MKISESQKILKKYGINVLGSVASLKQVLAMKRPLVLKADTEYCLGLHSEKINLHSNNNGYLSFVLQATAGKELHLTLEEINNPEKKQNP